MVISPAVRDLLDRAGTARAAGRGVTAARLYDEAASRGRADGDLDGWTEAVLGGASVYLFGAEPGKLPAQLGRHLQTRIHTGLNCSYEPDPGDGLDWVLDGRPAGT